MPQSKVIIWAKNTYLNIFGKLNFIQIIAIDFGRPLAIIYVGIAHLIVLNTRCARDLVRVELKMF